MMNIILIFLLCAKGENDKRLLFFIDEEIGYAKPAAAGSYAVTQQQHLPLQKMIGGFLRVCVCSTPTDCSLMTTPIRNGKTFGFCEMKDLMVREREYSECGGDGRQQKSVYR